MPQDVPQSDIGKLLSQFSLHLQLLQVEFQEEMQRLWQMHLFLLLCLSLFVCTMFSLALLVISLSWDTPYRVPSIGLLLMLFGCGTGFTFFRLKVIQKRGAEAFVDSRQEFAADFALLKNRLHV